MAASLLIGRRRRRPDLENEPKLGFESDDYLVQTTTTTTA